MARTLGNQTEQKDVRIAAAEALRHYRQINVARVLAGTLVGRDFGIAWQSRWSLRILWELRDGPHGARELRARCDAMSPSVLYQRLAELSSAGLIQQQPDSRYRLTTMGESLSSAIKPLDRWAEKWAEQVTPDPSAER